MESILSFIKITNLKRKIVFFNLFYFYVLFIMLNELEPTKNTREPASSPSYSLIKTGNSEL